MYSVSIIIPAYNEEKRLPETLKKISSYINETKLNAEIIVINDGSVDKTADIVNNFKVNNVRLINNEKNRGKGFCINRGVFEARNEIILFSDSDLSTPIEFLGEFLKNHEIGYDIVIASRAIKGAVKKVKQPFFRDTMGKIFNIFVRTILGLNIKDTQCGFKSFKNNVAKEIFSKQTIFDFGFDPEILYIAQKKGYKIKEYPVEWYDSKGTKVKAIKDSFKMFFSLFKIKKNYKKGIYN
jgi:dolichyl-phosphate beta-glucosyltransferase